MELKSNTQIPFHLPTLTGKEAMFIQELLSDPALINEGIYASKVEGFFGSLYPKGISRTTKSCTQAIELAALLLEIGSGDEVIMPSFTHVSTANPFVLRGAIPVFVDITPDTMNIDEALIEDAITEKTKAIITPHYGGVGCEMDTITEIARRHNLAVIEDNAHGILATYKNKALGSFGDISCISFDYQKNITCHQGGAITINSKNLENKFYNSYDFGTNKREFLAGNVKHYEWMDMGSNYPLSELDATFLCAQLEESHTITENRLYSWNLYYETLWQLCLAEKIVLPKIPAYCDHNGHIFYIHVTEESQRNKLISYLANEGIVALSHFQPLHSSAFGEKAGRFSGTDDFTTKLSQRIIRLPLYYNMKQSDISFISEKVIAFFG